MLMFMRLLVFIPAVFLTTSCVSQENLTSQEGIERPAVEKRYSLADLRAAEAQLKAMGGYDKALSRMRAADTDTPLSTCVRICNINYDRCDPKRWATGTCEAWLQQCVSICYANYGS